MKNIVSSLFIILFCTSLFFQSDLFRTKEDLKNMLDSYKLSHDCIFESNGELKKGYTWMLSNPIEEVRNSFVTFKKIENTNKYFEDLKKVQTLREWKKLLEKSENTPMKELVYKVYGGEKRFLSLLGDANDGKNYIFYIAGNDIYCLTSEDYKKKVKDNLLPSHKVLKPSSIK